MIPDRTSPCVFQDRCLKPLGHPSVAATSITWRAEDQERVSNVDPFGAKRERQL